MYNKVMRGEGTSEELEVVRKALSDPQSPLHDWLEGVTEWAVKVFSRPSREKETAEQKFRVHLLKSDRNDILAFIRRKHAEGRLSDQQVGSILAAGALEADEQSSNPQTHGQATQRMLKVIQQLTPELLTELQTLASQHEHEVPG